MVGERNLIIGSQLSFLMEISHQQNQWKHYTSNIYKPKKDKKMLNVLAVPIPFPTELGARECPVVLDLSKHVGH